MAGHGPAPKDPAKRRRRNVDPVPATTVVEDGALRGPELPVVPGSSPEDAGWHPMTVAWWQTWRESPQAQAFTGTDWDFLLDTAVLHSGFWSGRTELAAELRLRVAKFGSTPEDRMRLRMQVAPPTPGEVADRAAAAAASSAKVTEIASRRDRLTG